MAWMGAPITTLAERFHTTLSRKRNQITQGPQVHAFCDASPSAYRAAVYVVPSCSARPQLLIAKAGVAPIKTTILPQLEHLGALIKSKLLNYVSSALTSVDIYCTTWFYSAITLLWIKGDRMKWKQFVSSRLKEIGKRPILPDGGQVNPALTRGVSMDKVLSSSTWKHGPDWLSESDARLPLQPKAPTARIICEMTAVHVAITGKSISASVLDIDGNKPSSTAIIGRVETR
ncbi:hypothetical protein HPB50_001088 [Hyalomma asiaticum]|uniref:Uncharacterized protein n=1 Tax=Hyalomma asiaticum TaxID=266040 RepID=A0ACB7TCT2_HYAAI|nr:hypothetical protein HPB50_001088 [Hyalomma asiaticum]